MSFEEFLRTPFLRNTSGRLLLQEQQYLKQLCRQPNALNLSSEKVLLFTMEFFKSG